MVKKVKIILTGFALMLGFCSCNKVMPTGFWKDYQKDFLKKDINDQGPQGGHRAMYWQTERQGTFSATEVIEFAKKNGWELVDSLEVQAQELQTWHYNKAPVFPLSYAGFSTTITSHRSEYEYFPRWIKEGLKVYKFKTGWLAYEPGTDESTEINGFIVLNREENEMSVYHLWGE